MVVPGRVTTIQSIKLCRRLMFHPFVRIEDLLAFTASHSTPPPTPFPPFDLCTTTISTTTISISRKEYAPLTRVPVYQ
jgi:hypothetical protein